MARMAGMEIMRNIYSQLVRELSRPEVSILLGARQVGKTTLLKALHEYAKNSGLNSAYFNLEFPDDLQILGRPVDDLFKYFSSGGTKIIFLDEFQYIENASRLFKALYDLDKGIKIFASSSSSLEIHKHMLESLAGRRLITHVHPLCLQEMNVPIEDFLIWGGLPGLTHEYNSQSKMRLLQGMVETYLLRDVKSLVREEHLGGFNRMLYLISERQGQLVPVSSLAAELSLTAKTVEKYLEIMEHTYVLFSLPSYSSNYGNELKKSRKYFLYDLGIRNMLIKDLSPLALRNDKGLLAETFVLLMLKMQQSPNVEVRFWRTKHGDEVDFIWIENRTPVAIEVKSQYNADNGPPKGIGRFIERYPSCRLAIVFREDTSIEVGEVGQARIVYLPWSMSQDLASVIAEYRQ